MMMKFHRHYFLKTSFVFVFRRYLQDVFKTSSSRRIYSPYSYVFRRRFQEVFKTSSRCLDQDQYTRLGHTSWRRFEDENVFKTSSRRLQDIFKTSSGHLQDVFKTFWRRLQDVCKTYHHIFKTFLRSTSKTLILWRICLGHASSEKFMVSVQHLQEWQKFLKY